MTKDLELKKAVERLDEIYLTRFGVEKLDEELYSLLRKELSNADITINDNHVHFFANNLKTYLIKNYLMIKRGKYTKK